uniref:Uncharacterized mitochondrial protein AtMg00810-like n=1 Tax=Nicotiana tabacum TaxID=4097 RepID=A0A1S3YH41_TOBAC
MEGTRGFKSSLNDYSLLFKISGELVTILAIYVDDILITRNNAKEVADIKHFLNTEFIIKDLGEAHYFLGLELVRVENGFVVTQRKFALDFLTEFDCLSSRHGSSPLDPSLKLYFECGTPLYDPITYRQLIGKLKFLTNTRPDLTFVVKTLSQYMQMPCTGHYQVVALSSAEAKYRSMRRLVAKFSWVVRLLQDISIPPYLPVALHFDNCDDPK